MSTDLSTRPSLDDLDDYHVNLDDDPFRSPSPLPTQNDTDSKKRKSDGLGIDEEVDVTKRARVPRVKLDETRLLSDDGIPKLRRRAAGLKFKGKGHEFSDAARLLTFYQFWLDDLFPKAKFVDALAMVEKAGHKRVLVNKRAEWIDELKPRPASDETDQLDPPAATAVEEGAQPTGEVPRPAISNERTKTPQAIQPGEDDDDGVPDNEGDLYGATPRKRPAAQRPTSHDNQNNNNNKDDNEGEDDLEALIAEAEAETQRQAETQSRNRSFADAGSLQPEEVDRGPDEDEEEAMAEIEGLW